MDFVLRAVSEPKSVSLKTPMGKKANDLYNKFCDKKDNGNLDYSAIIKNIIKE